MINFKYVVNQIYVCMCTRICVKALLTATKPMRYERKIKDYCVNETTFNALGK